MSTLEQRRVTPHRVLDGPIMVMVRLRRPLLSVRVSPSEASSVAVARSNKHVDQWWHGMSGCQLKGSSSGNCSSPSIDTKSACVLSNPTADKTAQRRPLMPNLLPCPTDLSALHVNISPSAGGPSDGLGCTISRMFSNFSLRSANRSFKASVDGRLDEGSKILSTFDSTTWCGIAFCRKRVSICSSVFLTPCSASMRRKARRNLSSHIFKPSAQPSTRFHAPPTKAVWRVQGWCN